MRIFNLQGLGAPDKPKKKKKIKYAEIDFTSHYSFLRVRRDQFRQNCKKTHPNEQQLYDVCSVQVVSGASLNFFLMIFKDGPLENFDRYLKIDPPFSF
jgi:hypothetical protein